MDITIFAWIFIIVFFLVYTGVQTQRCCKTFQKSMARRRNRNNATTNVTEIYTVEGNGRQHDAISTSTIDFSVSTADRSYPLGRSANMFYLSRSLSVRSDDDTKKDEGLPSYEEAIAIIKTTQPSTTISTMQLSSQPSATGTSPSVVINIQAQVTPT